MCYRGAFKGDMNTKCLLCTTENNGIKHVINKYKNLKNEREELIKKLNELDNNAKTLLEAIVYYYLNKKLSNSKIAKKTDCKGIKLIKEFIKI